MVFVCLLALLWSAFPCGAVVKETASLASVLAEDLEKTLILLDIDDTLIRYDCQLGSTPWFTEMYGSLQDEETFHRLAGLLAVRLRVVCCEEETTEVVHRLQRNGNSVVGITGRFAVHPGVDHWPERTVAQLASVGIAFLPSCPEKGRVKADGILLLDGVLMCGATSKNEAIGTLLKLLSNDYRRVILVDDRQNEVEAFDGSLSDVETVGIWYRRMEIVHAGYDTALAQKQLHSLLQADIILSDEEALAQLKEENCAADCEGFLGIPHFSAL